MPRDLTVRVVYDIDRTRAEALARSMSPAVEVAASPEAAVAGGVDLAIIATYHRDLVPLAMTAVDAGCHVLVEKPGARSTAELRLLDQRALSRNRVVRVGYNHRFHPSVLRARELIRSRGYGDVISVRGRYGHGGRLGYEDEWRADAELSGGGELMDQGVHLLDMTRWLVGGATLRFAELRNDYWDCPVEDNVYLGLELRRGGFAWLQASWTEWKNLFSFEVSLQRAKLEICGLGGSYGTERLTLYEMLPEMGPPRTTSWEWPFPDSSWERELVDVMSAVAGGASLGAGIDDALEVLEIVEQAYASGPVVTRHAADSANRLD
jgi:predicted dehydrogenase